LSNLEPHMIEVTTQHGCEIWTLSTVNNGARAAFIPARGGIGISLVLQAADEPKELLYLPPTFWHSTPETTYGGWPFLFPICGRLKRGEYLETYRYNNQLYKLPIHGFASRMPWEAKDKGDTLVMTLRDTAETRAAYPFSFEISLAYQLTQNEFICKQTYKNTGETAMPYYAGFHPYFLTPAADSKKAQVQLRMDPNEQVTYNRDYSEVRTTAAPRQFPVSIGDLTLNENGFCTGPSTRASLLYPDSTELHMAESVIDGHDMFPYMHVYTKADEPFFCIEPWMGLPNGLNSIDGCRWIPPGGQETAEVRVWIE